MSVSRRFAAPAIRLSSLLAGVTPRGSGITWIGAAVALAWLAIAVLAPLIAPTDPLVPSAAIRQSPTPQHIMGTDELGRDVLSRVIWAARTSIPYSMLMVAGAAFVGGLVGGASGYFGGWVDEGLMRIADLVFAFPTIILAMAVAAALGPGLHNAVVAIVIVSWPAYARVVRSLVLTAMHSDYVAAARVLGLSAVRTLAVDVAPNVIGPVLVLSTLALGQAMLLLAGLSFLGLGAQPPTPEWGSMISIGAQNFFDWWLALFPGLAIFTAVFAFNLLGDSVRDSLDPQRAAR